MNFTKLVPNVFYVDMNDALNLFVDCLQFDITHQDLNAQTPLCVVEKDGLKINLFQDKTLAEEHHPELRLETNDIDEVYEKIASSHPALLHPNLNKITLRPWGAREFAIMDKQVGVIIQAW